MNREGYLTYLQTSLFRNPITIKKILDLHPEPSESADLSVFGFSYEDYCSFDFSAYKHRLEKLDIQIVSLDHPHYPNQLKEIADPPAVLFIRGRVDLLSLPIFSVVGARKISLYGKDVVQSIVRPLCSSHVVCSGMALGVDSVAHNVALDAGLPTIAVLGTGVDVVYPAYHRALYKRIVEKGVVISEFPPGTQGRKFHFPQRNRVISGLAVGVLVVEAARKSGSLITARTAMEQNREVFAIPGSIFSSLSAGCHDLIKDGAKLVDSIQDVWEELGHLESQPLPFAKTEAHPSFQLADDEKEILALMSDSPVTVDELVEKSGFAVAKVLQILTNIQIEKLIEQIPGNQYRVLQRK